MKVDDVNSADDPLFERLRDEWVNGPPPVVDCGQRNVPAPHDVYRIVDRRTGHPVAVYSRSYHDELDFASPEDARSANCHDIHKDRATYAVAKYRVTYTLIEPDAD